MTDGLCMLWPRNGKSSYLTLEALDCPPERLFPRLRLACIDSSKLDNKRGMSCASTAKHAVGNNGLLLFFAFFSLHLSHQHTKTNARLMDAKEFVLLVYYFSKRRR